MPTSSSISSPCSIDSNDEKGSNSSHTTRDNDVVSNNDGDVWFEMVATGPPKQGVAIHVSNPNVPLPSGLCYLSDFVSEDERNAVKEELLEHGFAWEGFEQRRRVWRFPLTARDGEHSLAKQRPEALVSLAMRMEKQLNLRGDYVSIEEFPRAKWNPIGENATHQRVTTFESTSLPPPADNDANDLSEVPTNGSTEASRNDNAWFVAYIPLDKPAIQHINQPAERLANFWKLASPNHQTDIRMEPGSLLVKTGACLWNWRRRIRAGKDARPNDAGEDTDPVLVLKMYKLPTEEEDNNFVCDDGFGYIPRGSEFDCEQKEKQPQQQGGNDAKIPYLEDLLTIVITTSPIRSNPSTQLIERTIESFVNAGPDFAYKCRKVIVCDGYRVSSSDTNTDPSVVAAVTKRYGNNAKQAMRNGIVSEDQAERYRQFKEALHQLCNSAKASKGESVFQNTVIEELEERHGFGFALRHAVCHCVATRFVCVIQHDRTFMRPTPVYSVVKCMIRNPGVKYVGFSMRSNLMYRDIFVHKYGKTYVEEFDNMILRPPELLIDKDDFGPDSRSARVMSRPCVSNPTYRSRDAIYKSYISSNQRWRYQKWFEQNPSPAGMHQMSLTPTLFWYDNTHICETAHYRDFVFDPSYKMVARGGFVEDKLSPIIVRTVERFGLKEGHSRFGSYILDDHSGFFFTGHLDGGAFLTAEQRSSSFPMSKVAHSSSS